MRSVDARRPYTFEQESGPGQSVDPTDLIARLIDLAELGKSCRTPAGLREARECLVGAVRLQAGLSRPAPAPLSDPYAPLSAEAWQAEFGHLAE